MGYSNDTIRDVLGIALSRAMLDALNTFDEEAPITATIGTARALRRRGLICQNSRELTRRGATIRATMHALHEYGPDVARAYRIGREEWNTTPGATFPSACDIFHSGRVG